MPLRSTQIARLSKEDRKAYFEEYANRVNIQEKEHWREEVRRLINVNKEGQYHGNNCIRNDVGLEGGSSTTIPITISHMPLPLSYKKKSFISRYWNLDFMCLPRPDPSLGFDHFCGVNNVSNETHFADAGDTAPGAYIDACLKNKDIQSQILFGQNPKVAVHVGINSKHCGHITVRTSTSEQFQFALVGLLPITMLIFNHIYQVYFSKRSIL